MAQGKVTYNKPGFEYDAIFDGNKAFRFWDDFLQKTWHEHGSNARSVRF